MATATPPAPSSGNAFIDQLMNSGDPTAKAMALAIQATTQGNSAAQTYAVKAYQFLQSLMGGGTGYSAGLAAFQQKLIAAQTAAGAAPPRLPLGTLDSQTLTYTTGLVEWAAENNFTFSDLNNVISSYTAAYQNSAGIQGGNAWPIPVAMPNALDVASATDATFQQLMGRRATADEHAAVAAIIDKFDPTKALATKAGSAAGFRYGLGGPAEAISAASGAQQVNALGQPIPPGAPQGPGAAPLTPGKTAQPSGGGLKPASAVQAKVIAQRPTALSGQAMTQTGQKPGQVPARGLPQGPTAQGPADTVNISQYNTPPSSAPGGAAPVPQPTSSTDTSGNPGYRFVSYTPPPTPSDAAEQYALTNERPEVNGMLIANILNGWAQFIGQA